MTKTTYFTGAEAGRELAINRQLVEYYVKKGWLIPDATTHGGAPLFLLVTLRMFEQVREKHTVNGRLRRPIPND
jgi:hypothetical protein